MPEDSEDFSPATDTTNTSHSSEKNSASTVDWIFTYTSWSGGSSFMSIIEITIPWTITEEIYKRFASYVTMELQRLKEHKRLERKLRQHFPSIKGGSTPKRRSQYPSERISGNKPHKLRKGASKHMSRRGGW